MTTPVHTPRAMQARFDAGWMSCAECIGLSVTINDAHVGSRGEAPLEKEAAAFAERLVAITARDPHDPVHRGFVGRLNTVFDRLFMRLVDFESSLDLANEINRGAYPAFATVHGEHGIERIVQIENRDPPIPLPAVAQRRKPEAVESAPIDLVPCDLADMPELLDLPVGGTGNELLEGSSRAAAAIAWGAGMFMRMHKRDAGELTLMEYGPRMAVGTMALAARMGMQVAWREVSPQAYVHTSHQLQRLPSDIQKRISFVPEHEYRQASIALWNMPWPNTPFCRMGAALDSGGMLMIQSEWELCSYRESWRQFMEIGLPRGQYVFPSSFLHVMPRTFQTWCSFR